MAVFGDGAKEILKKAIISSGVLSSSLTDGAVTGIGSNGEILTPLEIQASLGEQSVQLLRWSLQILLHQVL